MKVRDKRHHSPTLEEDEAELLLEELTDVAIMQASYKPGICRFDCADTEHYHGKPGAFIERLPQEKKDILKKLKGD